MMNIASLQFQKLDLNGLSLYLFDIPVINARAVELVKKHNANYVFECASMYLGKAPEHRLDQVFGITTFELGIR